MPTTSTFLRNAVFYNPVLRSSLPVNRNFIKVASHLHYKPDQFRLFSHCNSYGLHRARVCTYNNIVVIKSNNKVSTYLIHLAYSFVT